ncbi:hypothetical protein JHK87_025625 [Glycine soja]|nr:hypothetical protein JHK87_025625 [Glycine soja]
MFHPLLVLTFIQCHSHLIFEPLFPNLATPNLTCRKLNSFTDFSKISSFDDLGFIICGSMGHIAVDVMIVLSHVLVQLGSGMNLVNEVMERRFYGSRYCLWPRWVMELVISLVALLRVSYKNGKVLSFKYGSKQFKKKGGLAARTATSNVFRSAGYKFIDG